jgi:tRNA-guanine family transglycosylase
MSGEILASMLSSLHNVSFYLDTLARIRQAILLGTFKEFSNSYLSDIARGQD